jgi:uncharacterized protein (DUF433 family)
MKNIITIDSAICNGKPTIRGSRITVQSILEYLSAGETRENILIQFPQISNGDIDACLKFAADLLGNQYSIRSIA